MNASWTNWGTVRVTVQTARYAGCVGRGRVVMTDALKSMSSLKKAVKKKHPDPSSTERAALTELVRAARACGEDITGSDGLLKYLTKTVLETALVEELKDHLGYEKHLVEGNNSGNSRNGT